MVYKIIATGSDGNATVINDSILIDCGVPYKALKHHVKRLRLVLLTHIHGDHFNPATVRRLAHERPVIRWAACEWMIQPLVEAGVMRSQIDVLKCGSTTEYKGAGLLITPVRLTHNVPNCGFKVLQRLLPGIPGDYFGRLFYATDTGTLDGITAKGYELYLVEANHTRAEIEEAVAQAQAEGRFSYRVAAAENHLSYEQAVDWLMDNMGPGGVWIPMHQHKDKGGAENGGTENVCKNDSAV